MAVLVLLRDGVPLVRFALGEVTTLGRGSDCEVQFADIELSRHHARITRDGNVASVGRVGQAVLSLCAVRESLWVGTAGGLGLLAPGASEVTVPPDVAEQPALRAPIVALGRVGDTLVAITPEQLAWRDPASRRWTLVRLPGGLGRVGALAADQGGVWMAGTDALAFWDLSPAGVRVLTVPRDVPGPVRDVALAPPYLWAATDSGVVRLARGAALR